ncbi:MAG: histidine kinase N-terminal 7TM domain-containing protein, partial [Rectinemataceae bacterium]|nr:histidine kinase N-terminal 7TM domain-containing protein [Rectinemataceae bacterium]
MILDATSLVPALSFCIYVPFAIFGLYNHKEKVNVYFLIYMSFMALWSFGSFMMHANTGIFTPLVWNRVMLIGMLGGPISIFGTLIGLSGTEKQRYNYLLYIGFAIYVILLFFNLSGRIVADAGFDANGFYYSLGKGASVAYFLSYFYLILTILLLTRQLKTNTNRFAKKTLRLVTAGVFIMLAGIAMNLYAPLGRYPIDLFSASINAAIIFFAVYKYRLVTYSSVVLNILLSIFVAVLSAAVFAIIFLPVFHLERSIPFRNIFLLSLVLGFISSVILTPLRNTTLVFMEKIYIGKTFHYYKGLREFSASLTSIVDLETLGDLTVEKVMSTFSLQWVCMLINDYGTRSFKVNTARNVPFRGGMLNGHVQDYTLKRSEELIKEFG